MSQPDAAAAESDEAKFDVFVRMPAGAKLEVIEHKARTESGIAPERVDALMRALRAAPEAKIGAGVSRERADRAKVQFEKAGLTVEINSVLALASLVTGAWDGAYTCPACAKRVVLPANRQCPECHVFVDKVTDEFLLKKKIMDQERARIENQRTRDIKGSEKKSREMTEAEIRDKVRKELEKEYGISSEGGLFSGKAGLMRLLILVVVIGGVIGGLNLLPAKYNPFARSGAGGTTAAGVDKMLDSVGPQASGGGAAGGAAGASGEAGAPTGDADIDDPLIQAAGGKRIGAKGLTIEQAVAAAQVLGKSVGNNTIERAMGNSGAGGPSGGLAGVANAAPGSPAGAAAAAAPAAVSARAKVDLTALFAKQMAELGQSGRAREVMKALKASPAVTGDPAAASAVRLADIEVHAWSVAQLPEGAARKAADTILSDAAAISDPVERAHVLARAGVILSRHPQLPPAAARAFLTQAADALKGVSDAKAAAAAAGDWAVSFGQVLLAEVTNGARMGTWSKANAAAAQLDTLIKQAPDAYAQARLLAIDHRVRRQLAQDDRAQQSLDQALALIANLPSGPAERAEQLRVVARLSDDGGSEHVQAAVSAMQAQLESKSGADKARALVQLALMHAEAGLRAKANAFARMAQATPGLSPEDSVAINTDLVVRGDLAEARMLHANAQYAESEAVIQRVGGYLL